MGVIPRCSHSWSSTERRAAGRPPDLDGPRVSLFLRTQSWWLWRGLEHAEDPATVGVVLGAHDASHESWCVLVTALVDTAPEAAAAVANLYSYHGRVIGCLERGVDPRLAPDVRAQVRVLMRERLDRLTQAAVVAARHGLPPPDPRHPAGPRLTRPRSG